MTEAEARKLCVPRFQREQYDSEGRWAGPGREPFELWEYRKTCISHKMGFAVDYTEEAIEYAVELPGLAEVIHIIPRAKISKEEMERHKAAKRQGLPSPLTQDQLNTLKWKREVFLRIIQSPTPPDVRQAGWWVNQIENVGDMMTAAYWGQRGLFAALKKIGLMKRGPAAKYTGWALMAKDIADIVNLFRMARTVRSDKKKLGLKSSGTNPLSTERKFTRDFKMKAKLPGVPDWIEIAQVTDQFFGIGVSFGPIVGFFSDLHWAMKKGRNIVVPGQGVEEPNQVLTDGFSSGLNLQQMGP